MTLIPIIVTFLHFVTLIQKTAYFLLVSTILSVYYHGVYVKKNAYFSGDFCRSVEVVEVEIATLL